MAHFVNDTQSKEDRKKKYEFCRVAGCDSYLARRMRDFRINTIIKQLYAKRVLGNKKELKDNE